MIALWLWWRNAPERQTRVIVAALACLAGAGLGASWLLASTLGNNNDLALRAAKTHTGGTGVIITDFAYHGVTSVIAEMSPKRCFS